MNKCHVFTDCDLDGAMSYLIYTWFTKTHPTVSICRVNDLENTVDTWLQKHQFSDFDKVFFFDLDTTISDSLVNKIDHENVHIYDHHLTHARNVDKYKLANINVREFTSCSRLLYRLRDHFTEQETLDEYQKVLLLMVDDYDCYELQIPNSYELNCLFWNYTGNRLEKFNEDFQSGFRGFTTPQQNIINFHFKKLNNIKNSLQIFTATLPVKDTQYKFVSTFADACINEVADHIINTYSADVGLVVNTRTKKISFRKDKNCDLDLSKLSKTMCDEAGGHEFAAGGILCEKFMNITKIFTPVN